MCSVKNCCSVYRIQLLSCDSEKSEGGTKAISKNLFMAKTQTSHKNVFSELKNSRFVIFVSGSLCLPKLTRALQSLTQQHKSRFFQFHFIITLKTKIDFCNSSGRRLNRQELI